MCIGRLPGLAHCLRVPNEMIKSAALAASSEDQTRVLVAASALGRCESCDMMIRFDLMSAWAWAILPSSVPKLARWSNGRHGSGELPRASFGPPAPYGRPHVVGAQPALV